MNRSAGFQPAATPASCRHAAWKAAERPARCRHSAAKLRAMKLRLRRLRLAALDAWDVVLRRRRPLTPARRHIHDIGGHDFHEIGGRLAALAIEFGELGPDERILDVGCGFGRLAVALTRHLRNGEYTGLDIDPRAIRWCLGHITPAHPNFWFAHADVANSHYNPRGRVSPEAYPFPCASASVDVAFASSLFTHLLPPAADHYVWEMSRVLKPGGRVVATFFLLDDAIRGRLADPLVQPRFAAFPEPYYAVADPADPEAAIAYEFNVVAEAFAARGLEVVHVERGAWRAVDNPRTYQDVIVARKR
jgi:SAM-dependent methyltransferase